MLISCTALKPSDCIQLWASVVQLVGGGIAGGVTLYFLVQQTVILKRQGRAAEEQMALTKLLIRREVEERDREDTIETLRKLVFNEVQGDQAIAELGRLIDKKGIPIKRLMAIATENASEALPTTSIRNRMDAFYDAYAKLNAEKAFKRRE